eukprot:8351625-Alexandrium_andersonii.AAC.1
MKRLARQRRPGARAPPTTHTTGQRPTPGPRGRARSARSGPGARVRRGASCAPPRGATGPDQRRN